jgi:thiol-disulfide isomerase/thioredoxin
MLRRVNHSSIRSWLCAAVLAGAFDVAACGAKPATMPPSSPSHLLRQPMPSFQRATLAGEKFDTEAHPNQVVVVKFFAQYCKPCQKTLPAVEALYRDNPDLIVIGVSEDESPSAAFEQVRQHGLTFPVVHDAGNVLAGRFRVSEMPVTFVRDRQGRVAFVGGPDKEGDQIAQAVRSLGR